MMSKTHLNRFFKRNKLKPRKLNLIPPELSISNSYTTIPTVIQGKE